MALLAFPAAIAAVNTLAQPARIGVATNYRVHAFVEAYAAEQIDRVGNFGSPVPVFGRVGTAAGGVEYVVEFALPSRYRRALSARHIGGNGTNSTKRIRVYVPVTADAVAAMAMTLPTLEAGQVLFNHARAAVFVPGQLDLRIVVVPDGVYLVHHDRAAPYGVRAVRLGASRMPVNAHHAAAANAAGNALNYMPAVAVGVRRAWSINTYQHRYIEKYASMHIARMKPYGYHAPELGVVMGANGAEYALHFNHGAAQREELAGKHLPGGIGILGYKLVRAYIDMPPAIVNRFYAPVSPMVADGMLPASAVELARGQLDILLVAGPHTLQVVLHERVSPFSVVWFTSVRLKPEANAHEGPAVLAAQMQAQNIAGVNIPAGAVPHIVPMVPMMGAIGGAPVAGAPVGGMDDAAQVEDGEVMDEGEGAPAFGMGDGGGFQ